MRILIAGFVLMLCKLTAFSQADDVIMTIDNSPVKLSEFTYIYEKNNGTDADYSQPSVEEYLDLFTNFKLKVKKAKDLGMDTIPSLQDELAGYRKQLAQSYLMDRELSERLLKEMYERRQQDVKVRHILFKLPKNASPELTASAWEKAIAAKEKIADGASFTDMAPSLSEDPASAEQGGLIGYITAWLPSGFYALENAAYNLPIGEISDPLKTRLGIHLVLVEDRRPAVGKIEVAHILKRKSKVNPEKAKESIQHIYDQIQKGSSFEMYVLNESEDRSSAGNEGKLQAFGINTFERSFEEAAFALKSDGDISQPIETKVGWHIIKRISKPTESYDAFKKRMKPELPRLERYQIIQDVLVEELKKEYNYLLKESLLDEFAGQLDNSFFTYQWKVPSGLSREPYLEFGNNMQRTILELANFAKVNTRMRMQYNKEKSPAEALKLIHHAYVKEIAMKFMERKLEEKYPDFAALMREYEEGILLFEVSKLMVWDKASSDTSGLIKFYNSRQGKYTHTPEAKLATITINPGHIDKLGPIYDFAKDHSISEIEAEFNTEDDVLSITVEEIVADDKRMARLKWEKGSITTPSQDGKTGTTTIKKVVDILPLKKKTLSESRGYVIADYQEYLEKEWVDQLRKEYDVKLNKSVINNIVK